MRPFRHHPPIDCNCCVRSIYPFPLDLLSGCANRKAASERLSMVSKLQAMRVIVGKRYVAKVGAGSPRDGGYFESRHSLPTLKLKSTAPV